jgi:chromosome segregation ATPase
MTIDHLRGPVRSDQRQLPEGLSWWTRLQFRWAVRFVNQAFERFPGLVSGIARLETSEAKIRSLERQLKETEWRKKKVEDALGESLTSQESALEELKQLRISVAGQFTRASTLIDESRSTLFSLLSAAEGASHELDGIQFEFGRFETRIGQLHSDRSRFIQIEQENADLRAELAAMTAEVAASQSETALEIDKLRDENKRLQNRCDAVSILEIEQP